jgi:MFS family permease
VLGNAASDRLAARLPFYYGYVMIPVAMMIQISTSPGQTFAISAFIPEIRQSLNLSDSEMSFAYMLGTFLAAFPLSTIGPLADRLGLRRLTILAVIALSAACCLAARVSGFATLLLAFFCLRFLGQGSLSLLSANSIAMWFRTRIGRVSAVMSVGGAIAFAWIPELISQSIVSRGWRETYQGISIWVLAIMLPIMLFLFRNRPEDLGQHVDGIDPQQIDKHSTAADQHPYDVEPEITFRDALRGRSFYILAMTNCLWALVATGMVFHLFTLCADRGMADVAPDLFKTLGFSMLAMQLAGGVLADWLPLNRLLGIGTAMLALATWLAWSGHTAGQLHCFVSLFGAGQGLILAVGTAVWVRYYGRTHLGSIRGSVWTLTVAGSGCGPLVMGVIRDRYGDFDPAIGMFFASMCGLALVAWWATPPRVGAGR